ncbi:MAG TPA: S53 family peptidase [Marmoricola sp.]|jgi:subtilase family serine protease|nr:S53 family peptidase [Marmoricola sp.]
MRKRSAAAMAAVLTTAAATVAAMMASPAQASPSSQPIPNTKPLWVAHARSLGHAAPAAGVQARVYLQPRGGLVAVRDAAVAMATPGNARYHQFLTPAQYHARYDATGATVRQVSSYLRSHGLHVTGVAAHHRYLVVRGTVSSAEHAFGTRIDRFRHDGRLVQAPTALVRMPASVAGSVLTVTGLDTTPKLVRPQRHSDISWPAGFRNAHPCSAYYGEKQASSLPGFQGETLPYAPCGYVGHQLRSAYEGSTALDGSGVTVAITDAYASPSIASDAATYAARHGDAPYAEGQLVQVAPRAFTHAGQCGANGWWGEETLDVEAVHAMAPGADIRYYGSASCYDADFLDTLGRVVDDGTASLVSNSWSDIEANETPDATKAYEAVFLQGGTEGISFLFSSGDDGDEAAATGTQQVDYPASDPYATAVGGTSDAIGANGSLLFQAGWGTEKYSLSADDTWSPLGFLYGAGGGDSSLFARPDYQAGVVSGTHRSVPDVAMDADPTTGMLVGQTQRFPHGVVTYDEYRIGGTSLASPLFAGMTALAVQAGSRAGLLNPTIYAHADAFTDVTGSVPDAGNVRADYANGVDGSDGVVYSVRTFGQDSSLTVTPGYDQVTGVGTPSAGWLTALQ